MVLNSENYPCAFWSLRFGGAVPPVPGCQLPRPLLPLGLVPLAPVAAGMLLSGLMAYVLAKPKRICETMILTEYLLSTF